MGKLHRIQLVYADVVVGVTLRRPASARTEQDECGLWHCLVQAVYEIDYLQSWYLLTPPRQ